MIYSSGQHFIFDSTGWHDINSIYLQSRWNVYIFCAVCCTEKLVLRMWDLFILFFSFHHKFIVESLSLQKLFNVFFFILVLLKLSPVFYLNICFPLLLAFILFFRHRHYFCCCHSFRSIDVSLEFSESCPIFFALMSHILVLIKLFFFIWTHYYCCKSECFGCVCVSYIL